MGRRRRASLSRLLLPALALGIVVGLPVWAGAAHAQGAEENPNVPVTGRQRPELDPVGIRLGSFLWKPALGVGLVYDDNVLATDEDTKQDVAMVVAPAFRLSSELARHSLALEGGAQLTRYREQTGEDTDQFFIRGDGRLDATRNLTLDGNAGFARLRESRIDPDSAGERKPIIYYSAFGDFGIDRRFGDVSVRLGLGAARFEYDGPSQEDQDRVQGQTDLRLTYALSPRVGLFVGTGLGRVTYDQSRDSDGLDRDRTEVTVDTGTALSITSVLFGEAAVGYTRATFADSDLAAQDTITFGVNPTWNVTSLTTLRLRGARDFGSTSQADASVALQTVIEFDIDHELRRNLLIGATLGYRQDSLEGAGIEDRTPIAGARLTYLINRRLSTALSYELATRDSNESSRDYTRNRFLISLIGRL